MTDRERVLCKKFDDLVDLLQEITRVAASIAVMDPTENEKKVVGKHMLHVVREMDVPDDQKKAIFQQLLAGGLIGMEDIAAKGEG